MQSCEFVVSISAIACSIAKDKSVDELALISAFFSQLGDTLATIAAHEALCCPADNPFTGTQDTNAKEA